MLSVQIVILKHKDVNNKDPKWRQELADIVAAATALKDRVHHVVEEKEQREVVSPDSKLSDGSIGIGSTNLFLC